MSKEEMREYLRWARTMLAKWKLEIQADKHRSVNEMANNILEILPQELEKKSYQRGWERGRLVGIAEARGWHGKPQADYSMDILIGKEDFTMKVYQFLKKLDAQQGKKFRITITEVKDEKEEV